MSFLEINEQWIKEKVKITNEKLDDIKSLSLPGTYDEKIFRLGASLTNFTRLKELDLSRNLLESLEGMEQLQCLESLNLYYNNVSLLKELYRLRNNSKLNQLDLRLNPVARNEADYRLCLIHMLPLLIRLDDRCVKDQERKAALMYFGSDQSKEFSSNNKELQTGGDRPCLIMPLKKTHPRVEMVNRWTKGIVKDDIFDMTRDRNNTFHLNLNEVTVDDVNNITAPRLSDLRSAKEYSPKDIQCLSKQRLFVERELSNESNHSPIVRKNYSTVPVYVRQEEHSARNDDRNCRAQGDERCGLGVENMTSKDDKDSYYFQHYKVPPSSPAHNMEINSVLAKDVTDRMCDLIDRYWNGNRSLHQHQTFITAFSQIVSSSLQNLSQNSELKDEVNYLKEHLLKFEEENIKLKEKVSELKFHHKTSNKDDVEDIKRTNKCLKDEIRDLKHKLEASEKICEMTDLLRESHESLITTNEQLRRQISFQNKSYKSKDIYVTS